MICASLHPLLPSPFARPPRLVQTAPAATEELGVREGACSRWWAGRPRHDCSRVAGQPAARAIMAETLGALTPVKPGITKGLARDREPDAGQDFHRGQPGRSHLLMDAIDR